jgi:hypothetical protein
MGRPRLNLSRPIEKNDTPSPLPLHPSPAPPPQGRSSGGAGVGGLEPPYHHRALGAPPKLLYILDPSRGVAEEGSTTHKTRSTNRGF